MMGMNVKFLKLPLPPTSNNMYAVIRRKGKIIHIPSKELKLYKTEMEYYPLMDFAGFQDKKKVVLSWLKEGLTLQIRTTFYFKHERLFSKKGMCKKLDTSNRIKPCHDAISACLGIDDSLFFQVYAEKRECPGDVDEHCVVEISPSIPVIHS